MAIMVNDSKALQYIHRIRNHGKHSYALAYLDYLRGYRSEPQRKDYALGYMGAQAVRTELYGLEAETT